MEFKKVSNGRFIAIRYSNYKYLKFSLSLTGTIRFLHEIVSRHFDFFGSFNVTGDLARIICEHYSSLTLNEPEKSKFHKNVLKQSRVSEDLKYKQLNRFKWIYVNIVVKTYTLTSLLRKISIQTFTLRTIFVCLPKEAEKIS